MRVKISIMLKKYKVWLHFIKVHQEKAKYSSKGWESNEPDLEEFPIWITSEMKSCELPLKGMVWISVVAQSCFWTRTSTEYCPGICIRTKIPNLAIHQKNCERCRVAKISEGYLTRDSVVVHITASAMPYDVNVVNPWHRDLHDTSLFFFFFLSIKCIIAQSYEGSQKQSSATFQPAL